MKKKEMIVVLLLIFGISQIFAADCGDVNNDGAVDIIDALLVAQYYVGSDPQPFDQSVADVNGDGSIGIIDALLIAQYYVGLIDELPGCVETTTPTPTPAPTPTIDPNAPIGPEGYIYCADEGDSVTFDVDVNVAYGANGSFNYLYGVTGTITFDNDTFGDPIYGVVKHGFYQEAGPPTPTPEPTETPVPTETPGPTETHGPEGLIAFPGAEGYGKVATGGRGGSVYEVTNLNSSGSGSLGDALSSSGRTIVFRVGGTISGGFSVPNNTTIAGQTAPGDGIEINGSLGIGNNTIVRYIRVRTNGGGDAIGRRGGDKIILDHVSASWSGDEVVSIYHCTNVTIQWSMITEACSSDHKFGGIWGNNYSTYHHNLFAHCTDRTPRIASGAGYNDVRNNVIYNWANLGTYGGEVHQPGGGAWDFCTTNVVANYYKPGPGTPEENKTRIISPTSRDGAADYGDWYVADNYLYGYPDVTADNWLGVIPHYWDNIDRDWDAVPGLKLDSPSEYMPIRQQTAEEAYLSVLDHVGCSLPNRDSVDSRIIEEVRNGTYTYGNNGFVSSPSAVGGHPTLQNGTPPVDSDHDGMPDAWEIANNLDPNDASDRNNTDAIGYTMLENYLNSIDNL